MTLKEYSLSVNAICIFVDIRGFTPLSTALDGVELSNLLRSIRSDCFVSEMWTTEKRIGWKQKCQKRYKIAAKRHWEKYSFFLESYPCTFGQIEIEKSLYPVAAFHKFLGDGILFVFELGPASETSEAKEVLSFGKNSSTAKPLKKDEIVSAILTWITELSLWRPTVNIGKLKNSSKDRVYNVRLGIGVSYGNITREFFLDNFQTGISKYEWDYHGDPINRAARLENLAKPGGAVFDVSNSYFYDILSRTWKEMMVNLKGDGSGYFFSKYAKSQELKGVGAVKLLACGEIGQMLIESADHMEKSDNVKPEQMALQNAFEKGAYTNFRQIPEKILMPGTWETGSKVAIQLYGSGAITKTENKSLSGFCNLPAVKQSTDELYPEYRDQLENMLGKEGFIQWQNRIIAMKRENTTLFDGDVARLLTAGPKNIVVGKSGYYWAAALEYAFEKRAPTSPFSGADLVERCFEAESYNANQVTFEYQKSLLGNHLGINLLAWVDDIPNGLFLLFQSRSGTVHVEKNKMCPTGSGTINWEDITAPGNANPLIIGAVRELRRETGIIVSPDHGKLRFLGLSREKQRLGTPDSFFDLCLGKAQAGGDGTYVVNLESGIDNDPREQDEWDKLFFVHFKITKDGKWFEPLDNTDSTYNALLRDIGNGQILLEPTNNIGVETTIEGLQNLLGIPGKVNTFLLMEKIISEMVKNA